MQEYQTLTGQGRDVLDLDSVFLADQFFKQNEKNSIRRLQGTKLVVKELTSFVVAVVDVALKRQIIHSSNMEGFLPRLDITNSPL